MQNNINEEYGERDVDVLDILVATFRWLKRAAGCVAGLISSVIRLTLKNIMLVGLVGIAAVLVSLVMGRPKARTYTMETELNISVMDANYMASVFNSVNKTIESEDRHKIANIFNCDSATAARIGGIRTYFIIDKPKNGEYNVIDYDGNMHDSTYLVKMDRIRLRIMAKDSAKVDTLLAGLAKYVASMPVVKKELKIRKEYLEQSIKTFKGEISLIDSMRKVEYFHKAATDGVRLQGSVFVQKDNQLYYNNIIELQAGIRNQMVSLSNIDKPIYKTIDFYMVRQTGYLYWAIRLFGVGYVLLLLGLAIAKHRQDICNFIDK